MSSKKKKDKGISVKRARVSHVDLSTKETKLFSTNEVWVSSMPLPLSFHPWNRRIVPVDHRVTHAPIAGRLLTPRLGRINVEQKAIRPRPEPNSRTNYLATGRSFCDPRVAGGCLTRNLFRYWNRIGFVLF